MTPAGTGDRNRHAGWLPIASSLRWRQASMDPHPSVARLVGLAAALAFAGWASGARPFTTLANIEIAIPSVLFLAALVLERRWPERGPWRRLPATRPESDGGAALWLVVIALLVAVELVNYFHGGPRADYPTVSSALNTLFANRAAKATGFFAWLVIGWFLARR